MLSSFYELKHSMSRRLFCINVTSLFSISLLLFSSLLSRTVHDQPHTLLPPSLFTSAFIMEALFYNADDGYLEAIVRGYRGSILNNTAYINLTQCETLDGKLSIKNYMSRPTFSREAKLMQAVNSRYPPRCQASIGCFRLWLHSPERAPHVYLHVGPEVHRQIGPGV